MDEPYSPEHKDVLYIVVKVEFIPLYLTEFQ